MVGPWTQTGPKAAAQGQMSLWFLVVGQAPHTCLFLTALETSHPPPLSIYRLTCWQVGSKWGSDPHLAASSYQGLDLDFVLLQLRTDGHTDGLTL